MIFTDLTQCSRERSGPGQGDMTKPPYGAGFWKGNTTARAAQPSPKPASLVALQRTKGLSTWMEIKIKSHKQTPTSLRVQIRPIKLEDQYAPRLGNGLTVMQAYNSISLQ